MQKKSTVPKTLNAIDLHTEIYEGDVTMWLVIVLIIIVIVVVVKKSADKAKAEQLEKERIEKQQKAQAEAKARATTYGVMTDTEKQKLSAQGGDILSTTLTALDKATKGDADAMLFMAITYQSKLQNSQKSAYWMQKSSNAGSSEAMYWLGEFYVSGYGVQENRIKGVSLIMDAAKKGNKQAIQSLKDNGMSITEMRSIGIQV